MTAGTSLGAAAVSACSELLQETETTVHRSELDSLYKSCISDVKEAVNTSWPAQQPVPLPSLQRLLTTFRLFERTRRDVLLEYRHLNQISSHISSVLHVDFDSMPAFLDHSDRVRDLGGDEHAAEVAAMEDTAKLQAFLSALVTSDAATVCQ